jgi:hypothetical protein
MKVKLIEFHSRCRAGAAGGAEKNFFFFSRRHVKRARGESFSL